MDDKEAQLFLWSMFSDVFGFCVHTFSPENHEESLFNKHYGFPTDFDVSRDRSEILEYLIDVDSSLGMLYPEIAKLWSKDENGELTPFMFTPGSNYPAIWKCPKCGNTWQAPISGAVQRKVTSCRTCSMKDNGKTITRAKTMKHGSLAEKCDVLLKQWDYEENKDLSPYDIPLNYSKPVNWKCDVCGYKWPSSPNSRIAGRNGSVAGCPHCTGRVPMAGEDDFETKYPDIAKEWDYKKNEGVLPSQIKPFTNTKYFWICPACGNSYPAYPGSRVKGHGCPRCGQVKVGKKNSKAVGQYDDSGTLINTYYGLHEAARAMGVVPNSIFQAVKSGRMSKGYYWRYV